MARKKNTKWRIEEHDGGYEKSFDLIPPDGIQIRLTVDYDDVAHDCVDNEAQQVIDVLNAYWE